MKLGILIGAAVLLAAPAAGQSVRAGIEAWQKGEPEAAVAAWAPLAAKGDADAAFNLGQAYRLGKGVPLNLARAQQYLEQAARKGHVDAATTLGILLFQNGNRPAAMRWLRKAAEAGEARAMLLYGTALYNGDGTAPDAVTAYAFVSRAAAQGLAAGQATLADLDEAMPLAQREKGLALAKAMVGAKTVVEAKAGSGAKAKDVAKPAPAPAQKPVVPPIPSLPVKARPVMVAASSGGGWRIQLGAFGQRATAEALFATLRGKVDARQAYYVPAGKVVRLQVGPYASRAAAVAACAKLVGQACFAVEAR